MHKNARPECLTSFWVNIFAEHPRNLPRSLASWSTFLCQPVLMGCGKWKILSPLMPIFFLYIFWRARVCWLRYSFSYIGYFCIFDRCLDSNLENRLSKQARFYQLSHPYCSHTKYLLVGPEGLLYSILRLLQWLIVISLYIVFCV